MRRRRVASDKDVFGRFSAFMVYAGDVVRMAAMATIMHCAANRCRHPHKERNYEREYKLSA